MKKILYFFVFLSFSGFLQAQDSLRVLFIGNSYTYTNNLPDIILNMALADGNVLTHQSSTPGGYTFQQHSTNATTLSLLQQGNWDYVVLQEQSQLPSFPDGQVQSDVFPYARTLDSLVNAYMPCAETVFYMTWGRQNGDAGNCASWPPVCTYGGMDSLLHLRYRMMADDNAAILSPVGAVWRYIRNRWPAMNLYSGDGSHPSPAGSFAAACAFYSVMYRKDPMLNTYNFSLSAADADSIRWAASQVVFDSLAYWNVGKYDPQADFSMIQGGNVYEWQFSDSAQHADTYSWNFGDGNTDNIANPTHIYDTSGVYDVQLVVGSCGRFDTLVQQIIITSPISGVETLASNAVQVFPNPSKGIFTINIDRSDVAQLVLLNALGQTVESRQIQGLSTTMLDLSGRASGNYWLLLSDEKGKTLERKLLIKQ